MNRPPQARPGWFICRGCAELEQPIWPGSRCYRCGANRGWLDPLNLSTDDMLPARGLPSQLTGEQVRDAYLWHVVGKVSIRDLGRWLHQDGISASEKAAANTLNNSLGRRGWPRRERMRATVAKGTVHGLSRRTDRSNPASLAHRRALKRANGTVRGVMCKATTNAGQPCKHAAMRDSEWCAQHAPDMQAQLWDHLRRMRLARRPSA